MKISTLLFIICISITHGSFAQLAEMDDNDLGLIAGQAFISVDASSNGAYEYAKINLGLDIEFQGNIDELRLGEFDRVKGDSDGTVSDQVADVIINNFGLGRVDGYDTSTPSIVPFQIKDPYVEIAYKDNAGVREIAGFRIGFDRARGDLSGDFQSLTGNMQGLIQGSSSTAYDVGCGAGGNVGWVDCLQLAIAGDISIYAEAVLVQEGTGNTTSNGHYLKRAEWLGIPAGDNFQTDESGLIAALLPALSNVSNCEVLGLDACFPIGNYRSFFVGDRTDSNIDTGGAKGIFLSLQSMDVPWKDYANGGYINTEKGAFMNFAKSGDQYPFVVDLYSALIGTARTPTCIGQTKGC
jgi:hypothetical protein